MCHVYAITPLTSLTPCTALRVHMHTRAGWGNTGAGATLLLMPLLFEAFASRLPEAIAWRVTFLVPGSLQVLSGILVLLYSDDRPAGRGSKFR